jgi:hypothetical protein
MENNRIAFKSPPRTCIFPLGPYAHLKQLQPITFEIGLSKRALGCMPWQNG